MFNFKFCPLYVFTGFVWFSEKTAIISLNNINQLTFVMEKFYFWFAIGTESLNII
jgi:hypothetical protein